MLLRRMEQDPQYKYDLAELRRFHYLYQRASADLAKVATFAAEGEVRRYLESLVARATAKSTKTALAPIALARWPGSSARFRKPSANTGTPTGSPSD